MGMLCRIHVGFMINCQLRHRLLPVGCEGNCLCSNSLDAQYDNSCVAGLDLVKLRAPVRHPAAAIEALMLLNFPVE